MKNGGSLRIYLWKNPNPILIMKRLFLFCLVAFSMVSCNNELATEFPSAKIKSYHLIDVYEPWDYVKLEAYNNFDTGAKGVVVYLWDDIPCNEIVSREYAAEWNKSPKQSYKVSTEGFDELAKKNNDEGYEWDVLVVYDLLGETAKSINCHMALERGVKSIDVVSDSDFDKDHPAGTSLNDVVKFYGTNYSQYLTSNVNKKKVDITNYYLGDFNKLCSEITESDLKIIGPSIVLEFIKQPTLTKQQKLTIKITDTNGEVYSDTVEVNF